MTTAVVNQWLSLRIGGLWCLHARPEPAALPGFETPVARNPRSSPIVRAHPGIFLTVQGRRRFVFRARGRKGRFAMFETMTAVMGLLGAGIFLAHAFEGIRSRV